MEEVHLHYTDKVESRPEQPEIDKLLRVIQVHSMVKNKEAMATNLVKAQ